MSTFDLSNLTLNLCPRGETLLDLIQKPTAKETATVKRFKTEGGPAVREYCPHLTKDDCSRCAHPSLTLSPAYEGGDAISYFDALSP
jgi:hypothetical protein